MLTRCIAPDKAYPLLSELFHKQEEWAFGNEVKTKMKEIALAGGLTEETFKSSSRTRPSSTSWSRTSPAPATSSASIPRRHSSSTASA